MFLPLREQRHPEPDRQLTLPHATWRAVSHVTLLRKIGRITYFVSGSLWRLSFFAFTFLAVRMDDFCRQITHLSVGR